MVGILPELLIGIPLRFCLGSLRCDSAILAPPPLRSHTPGLRSGTPVRSAPRSSPPPSLRLVATTRLRTTPGLADSALRDVLRRAASCHRAKSIGGHPGRRALRSLLLSCAFHDDPPAAGNPFATAHAVAVATGDARGRHRAEDAAGIPPAKRKAALRRLSNVVSLRYRALITHQRGLTHLMAPTSHLRPGPKRLAKSSS